MEMQLLSHALGPTQGIKRALVGESDDGGPVRVRRGYWRMRGLSMSVVWPGRGLVGVIDILHEAIFVGAHRGDLVIR